MREPVGDFYVHLVKETAAARVAAAATAPPTVFFEKELTSSTALLSRTKRPTVIHFYDGGVQFLCVCVDSPQVAAAFQNMFFSGGNDNDNEEESSSSGTGSWLVNSFIPSRHYMPVGFGQLGCSGFIVSDAKGNFVSRKTRAYLQYGEAAFGHVESLLRDELMVHAPGEDKNSEPVLQCTVASTPRQMDPKKKPSAPISAATIQPPASVGVEVLDDEHAICAESFRRARKDPTAESLRELHDILKAHFDHEEELLAKHSSSKSSSTPSTSGFSSIASHKLDHDRILRLATAELERPPAAAAATPALPSLPVDVAVLDELAAAFHQHADQFDALYEGTIPADAE
eukprot:jgi/Psemu1/3189/gm1.3189_g